MKTLTKSELATLMNVSSGTLQSLMNRQWFENLKMLGYKKKSKILSPRIVNYIIQEWGLEFEPD